MRISGPGDGTRIELDAVDLADPGLYAHGDPHPIWRVMRRLDPIRWHPVDRDLGFWSVTTYEHGDRVLRDHAAFTSQRGTLLNLLGKEDPAGGRQMAATDPPRHLARGRRVRRPEATLKQAHRELFAYFADIVRRRQRDPGDDLVSLLATADVDGRVLDRGEIISNCYSLLLGADVTTPHVPSAMLDTLAGTPQLADVLAHPELVAGAVEEALRWASPANHFMRHAVEDVELAGRKIRSGDAVVVWLGSANRDESVFSDPYDFDIRRKPNRHIAFGSGPHYCVGHTVARVSLRILFEELVNGFAAIERAGETEHLCSNFVAGVKHLPVIAEPRARGGR